MATQEKNGTGCPEMLLLEWNSGRDKAQTEGNACFVSAPIALTAGLVWELPSIPQQSLIIQHRSEERGAVVRQGERRRKADLRRSRCAIPVKRGSGIVSPLLQRYSGENLSKWNQFSLRKLWSPPPKLHIKDQVGWSSRGFPRYRCNAGNWGKQNEKKKYVLNNRSLKLINAQKVVWRWKALLLSVINSGVTPLLIINNNNATEHATCKDLKILLKYESQVCSDSLNGKMRRGGT